MAITISYPLHMITHIFIPLDKIVPDVVLLLMLNRNLRFKSIFHILMHYLFYHKNILIQRNTCIANMNILNNHIFFYLSVHKNANITLTLPRSHTLRCQIGIHWLNFIICSNIDVICYDLRVYFLIASFAS